MSDLAAAERQALVELLTRTGPNAPTLCGDWTTHDLAAHLVARERRPDAAGGLFLSALAGWTERVRLRYARLDHAELLGLLAKPPKWSPLSHGTADEFANAVEFFVHHEDVRRAADGWAIRSLSRADEELLWHRTAMARVLLRRAGMTVKLVCPGFGQRTIGKAPIGATVTGPPGEVLLYCFGRKAVARVEVTGDRAAELEAAPLGL